MPAAITNVTTQTENASTASLAITGVSAAIGDWLILAAAVDNSGVAGVASLSTAVTDSAGNVWVNRGGLINRTQAGAANDGTTLGIWTCQVTSALTAGSVTLSFSPNAVAKAVAIQKAVLGAGKTWAFSAVGPGVTAQSTTQNAGAVSVSNGQTIWGFTATEDNVAPNPDIDTSNGSWSAALTASTGATPGAGQTISVQWKTVTATGNQTYNTSTSAGRDYAVNYLIFTAPSVAISAAITDADDVVAGSIAKARLLHAAIVDGDDVVAGALSTAHAPRLSTNLRRVYASAPSGQREVQTLQLAHSAFPQTFWINNSKQTWTFDLGGGVMQTFQAVAFQITFPTMDGKGQQELQLAIDNVGRDAMEAIEAAAAQPQEPIMVTVRVFLNIANSLPQNTPPLVLALTDIDVTNAAIVGTANRADTLNRPFPTLLYRTDVFPGLDR